MGAEAEVEEAEEEGGGSHRGRHNRLVLTWGVVDCVAGFCW
jgi:hypothetical protein